MFGQIAIYSFCEIDAIYSHMVLHRVLSQWTQTKIVNFYENSERNDRILSFTMVGPLLRFFSKLFSMQKHNLIYLKLNIPALYLIFLVDYLTSQRKRN